MTFKRCFMATTKEIKNLFLFVTFLQSSSMGLTKNEIIEKCKNIGMNPSKRTIERWISTLSDLGLEIENNKMLGDHHLIRRYKIRNIPKSLLKISPLERFALERHLQIVSDINVKQAITKMLSIKKPLSLEIIKNNKILLEEIGYAFVNGARVDLNINEVIKIEQSIDKGTEVRFKYFEKIKKSRKFLNVKPLGLIFDKYCWLIAFNSANKTLLYRLDLIRDVFKSNILFAKPNKNYVKEWWQKKYGIKKGKKTTKISIKFSRKIAHLVENVIFHPSQTKIMNKDDSLILNLKCNYSNELIHELMHPDWLGEISILEPEQLKKDFMSYIKLCNKAAS